MSTIRRRIGLLAGTGKAADLLATMASHHLRRRAGEADLLLYVDGHVRAYQGTRKVARTHMSRLRFPAPATVETWVSDADGDPVLVVMAEPGAALAGELRRLLPQLREAVGDDRRVLVGFDRGGWSAQLFKDMITAGFDVLTWRKRQADPVPAERFTTATHVDETGRSHTWDLADTTVTLPCDGAGTVTLRQVTRREPDGRQLHALTSRTDLPPTHVQVRLGSRWRQENYFRYDRMRFDLDSHDSYTAVDDDPHRSVPNPAKKHAHKRVLAARAYLEQVRTVTDTALRRDHRRTRPAGRARQRPLQ